MKYTHLAVGLGNPEGKYFSTYHNVGFLAAEKLAERFGAEFKKKGNQLLADTRNANGCSVMLLVLKPLTYMNLSGQAVLAVCRKHLIPPENIIVFADDLYIEKGHIRVSFGGSGGGHNGLRSITDLLKTNQYIRIRIGILPEKPVPSMANYVLSRIDTDSRILIEQAVDKAVEAAEAILNGEKFEAVQGRFNAKNSVR